MDFISSFLSPIGQYSSEKMKLEHEKLMKINEHYTEANNQFRESIGYERVGDMKDLEILIFETRTYINNFQQGLPMEEAKLLIEIFKQMKIDDKFQDLHPYEVPIIFNYKKLMSELRTITGE